MYSHVVENYYTDGLLPYVAFAFMHPAQTDRDVRMFESKNGYLILHVRLGLDIDVFVERLVNILAFRVSSDPKKFTLQEYTRRGWQQYFKEQLNEIAR